MGIARSSNLIEYDIAMRQLAVKTPEEKSWINEVRSILMTYDLHSFFSLFDSQADNCKISKKTAICGTSMKLGIRVV